jgi:hypothetical protein
MDDLIHIHRIAKNPELIHARQETARLYNSTNSEWRECLAQEYVPHNRRRNWHILDTKARRIRLIMLPHMRIIIQILLLLHRPIRRSRNDIDSRQPLAGPSTNIPKHDSTERVPMNSRQRFTIHFLREKNLIEFGFAIRH